MHVMEDSVIIVELHIGISSSRGESLIGLYMGLIWIGLNRKEVHDEFQSDNNSPAKDIS